MLVTQHAAELCALLVDDVYGELPGRILSALLTRGKANLQQLSRYTGLTTVQLRSGLIVLIQQNLLLFREDPVTQATTYEANADAAYNILRNGKILEMIGDRYGAAERELVHTLLLFGHIQISDLTEHFEAKIGQNGGSGKTNGVPNGEATVNGVRQGQHGASTGHIESAAHVNSLLNRLIQDGLVEVVHKWTFQSLEDIQDEVEMELAKKCPLEERKGKKKAEYTKLFISRLEEILDEGQSLKRKLDQNSSASSKRRRLLDRAKSNGWVTVQQDPWLDPNTVIRVNHEKCLVELRAQWLVRMASEFIGETTGKVYGALLRLIGQGIARCRPNQRVELMKGHDSIDEARYPAHPSFSTYEVLDVLDPSVDVLDGIGKVAPDQINHDIAERIQRLPPLRNPLLSDNGEEGMVANGTRYSDDEFSDDDEVMEDELSSVQASAGQVRAEMQTLGKATKVTFEDARDPNAERLEYVKKHLLLLCDSSFGFVRQSRRNKWTVDFEPLVSKLQEVELETIIEQTCGQRAVRLVRILKEKGKMDEKSLPGLALMSKKEFQVNMLQLELSGFVELQEVPRDNNRTAQRTLFLWYFDKDRSLGKTLDKLYKSMIRCLQTMEVQRQKEKHLLTHVERTDVKGHEEEALPLETYQKYLRHLGLQRKLLGQVMRLDDLVASIRDY